MRPDENLLPILNEIQPFTFDHKPLDPLWMEGSPRIWNFAYNIPHENYTTPVYKLIDGDASTYDFRRQVRNHFEYFTIDVGGSVPLERFVLRMPPESETDRLGIPLSNFVPEHVELSASQKDTQILRERSVLLASWMRNLYVPLEIMLGSVIENSDSPIGFQFRRQPIRYLRWRTFHDFFSGPDPRNLALVYADFEVYGRGFAGQSRYHTRVIDLGRPAMLGRVRYGISKWRRQEGRWLEKPNSDTNFAGRWRPGDLVEEADGEAAVSISLRTGTDSDPRAYFAYDDLGAILETDRADWESLRPRTRHDQPQYTGWRGPVTEDRQHWTGWSGSVNSSDARLEMPSGRYIQVAVKMESDRPSDAIRLDSLSIEVLPLLASELVGEVGQARDPRSRDLEQVPLGEETEFIFAIAARFDSTENEGFDTVHLGTPDPSEFLHLRMGNPSKEVAPDSVRIDEQGITLYLPNRVKEDENLQIGVRTVLYTISTQLRGEVFSRTETALRQPVVAGDATDEVGSNRLQVIGKNRQPVIGDLNITPRTITPNRDGINDRMRISYTLYGVLNVEVEIAFYTLAGQRLHQIVLTGQGAGIHRLDWNGVDAFDRLLEPGLYLCQLTALTDRGSFEVTRPVAVVY